MKNRFGAPRGRLPVHSRANEVKCLVRNPMSSSRCLWRNGIMLISVKHNLRIESQKHARCHISLERKSDKHDCKCTFIPPPSPRDSNPKQHFRRIFNCEKSKGSVSWWGCRVLNLVPPSCGAIYNFTIINSDLRKCHGTKKWLHVMIK